MSKSKRKDYHILKFKRGVELQIKEIGKGLWGDISYGIDRYTCLSSWRQCPAWFTFVSPVLSALLHILHLFHLSWPEYVWRIVVSCFTEYPSICTCLWYFSTLDLSNEFFFFFCQLCHRNDVPFSVPHIRHVMPVSYGCCWKPCLHLVKAAPHRLSFYKVTIFPFTINKYFQVDTLKLCTYPMSL